jgi:hypothetical protein
MQCVTSSDDTHAVIGIKVEEDTDVTIKVEEIPEPISFPAIKSEPEEVSYLSVCPSLDTSPISIRVKCLLISISTFKQLHYVEWEFQSLVGLCESVVRECACID